jgi:hypothetical protein
LKQKNLAFPTGIGPAHEAESRTGEAIRYNPRPKSGGFSLLSGLKGKILHFCQHPKKEKTALIKLRFYILILKLPFKNSSQFLSIDCLIHDLK